jgi:hypothetical protein
MQPLTWRGRVPTLWVVARMGNMMASYVAEISRDRPGCILFLLDQSLSMGEPFAGETKTSKAVTLADAINKLLMSLVLRCTQNVNEGPRNYFDIGVMGYGDSWERGPGPCLGGALGGRDLVSVKDLADNYVRVEERTRMVSDGAGGLVETKVKFPVWFDPVAEDGTPMREAIQLARDILRLWIVEHRRSYPPIVINITDGEPNDDPTEAARKLMDLETEDGSVLLYNLHLSGLAASPLLFPATSSGLPDEFARMLFQMSSPVPSQIQKELRLEGYSIESGAKGFVFNSDAVALIQFLDIGTRLVLDSGLGERGPR